MASQRADGLWYPQPRLHAKYIVLVQHARQLEYNRQLTPLSQSFYLNVLSVTECFSDGNDKLFLTVNIFKINQ